MSDPTEDRWADARRVLARRTPESIVTIDQGGMDVRTGPKLRSVLRLTVARRPEGIQGDWDQDALSLGWNMLPDLLAERDRYRAALERIGRRTISRELGLIVAAALAPERGDADPVALTAAPLTPEEAASLDAWYGRATPHPAGETPVQREGDGDAR